MSTKTTFKRVALVAVAALGLGVLTSVAPASAANASTAISAGTPAPARVGVASGATLITATSDTSTASGEVVTAQITSAPATSTKAVLTFVDANGLVTNGVDVNPTASQNTSGANSVASATYTGLAETSERFYVTLNADVAGTYQILVTSDGSTSSGWSAGKISTVYSVTTVGAPTSLTVSKVGAAVGNETSAGAIVKLTMKDANGNATVLGANEGISISNSLTNATTGTTLGASSFGPGSDVAGVYSVTVIGKAGTTDGTDIITFAGTGVLPSTLTINTTVSAIAATAAAGTLTLTSATGYAGSASPYTTAAKSSHGFTLTQSAAPSATVATVYPVKIAVTNGDTYATTVSIAATKTTGTVSVSQALSTTLSSVVVSVGASSVTINRAAAAANKIAVVNTVNTVLSATGGKNTFTAEVDDQFGNPVANAAVSVAVSGRNTVATTTLGVTNADGLISYTLTDAGTTGTRDTITFTATVSGTGSVGSALAYVNYGTIAVDKVTVSGGSKAETVAGSTLTSINAADNGPETSRVAIKAVVTDASGNLLAGVPVVFTVDSGLVYKTAAVDFATVYTGTDGSATTHVFDWKAGKQTITATAGGKSSTDYLTWASNTPSNARILSATATGDIVSLKVVDRFGNAVSGVEINLSRTGAGLFGNGASTQNINTDKNGTADVRYVGSGTVVAELAATFAQAYAAAGNITTAAATAATAGTTAGTGATLTPAGVGKVSLEIAAGANAAESAATAAADAAAEATDAANAATDAANAAAEAADAATAAAQDAADAVAALSTQVSEMIDSLKKQITALTNLVIKIQKKVRA